MFKILSINAALLLLFGMHDNYVFAQSIVPLPEHFVEIERGPSHKLWKNTQTAGTYIELRDGFHYWDDGWKESEDVIQLTSRGAVASKGQHKVSFESNINAPGAVKLTTADAKTFGINVLGLFYFDATTGRSAPLASHNGHTPPDFLSFPEEIGAFRKCER